MQTEHFTQVHIGDGDGNVQQISQQNLDVTSFSGEEARFQEKLLKLCPANLWHKASYTAGCPRPVLVGQHHQRQLKDLHEALTAAITDVVQRWWSDRDARFPERMPLEAKEEELLQWIESQVLVGNLPQFSQCRGSWRPDFLVEDSSEREENHCITEINARFSFNGFMHEAYGQVATNKSIESAEAEFMSATDPDTILEGLFSLFDPEYPLHLLKGTEKGIDIHMFINAVEHRFGAKPRLIAPADLRLVPDARSKSGFRLCCVIHDRDDQVPNTWRFVSPIGEIYEEMHQIGLELHQWELLALEPEMLRQISLRCFNDMRTILLVHDKRMLGIVRQEIPKLVERGVVTSVQAEALRFGVVETLLPGSPELKDLLQVSLTSPDLRHSYILKPIRSGKGNGIIFGEDVTGPEWRSLLQALTWPGGISEDLCVVQRRIIPRKYNLVLRASEGMVQYGLVGTYHVTNGKLLGLGNWRASGGRIVAVASGGSWICSIMRRAKDAHEECGINNGDLL
ncbi:multidrug transporter [Fusarium tjaetaba]|uniref:Multidrug transporter n=1 Tax=Fusarium tjaetaba TaxID=1567544 RepID=A0A8H5RXY7_9HYPO|nr:multidrug transporter [Fusarium tjaetaba]KAF5641773.1 multidrug transporter [Fusarium tjaetaba]